MVSILLGSGLSAVFSLVYIFQIFAFTPALMLPALLVIIVQAVLGVVSTVLTVKYERASMEASAKTSGIVTALLNGIQKVKLAGAEDLAFAKWARGYSEYARAAYNRPMLLNALPALVGLVGLLGSILIYYMAAITGVTYDNYMAFSVAFGQTTGAIMALTSIAGQIAQAKPMLDMVLPILDADPRAGRETVEAGRVPEETRALLAFMGRTDLPREIIAAASHFLCGHIHPFADGNGRLSRMLSCILLSGGYSHATVLAFLRRLHALEGDVIRMRDVREPFLRMAEGVSPWLSATTAEALRSFISRVPAQTTIVHGDVHMGNVIMDADGTPILIDADTVSMGAPVFDLACAYSTMVCEYAIDPERAVKFHGMPTKITRAVWESLLRCYCAEAGVVRSEEMGQQIEVIAWLLVLNRLKVVGKDDGAFGETALRILQTVNRLAKALGYAASLS